MFSDCATSQRRGELAQANKRQRLHPNGVVHYVMGKAVRPSRVFKPTDGTWAREHVAVGRSSSRTSSHFAPPHSF